jgi:hypothetical protein
LSIPEPVSDLVASMVRGSKCLNNVAYPESKPPKKE